MGSNSGSNLAAFQGHCVQLSSSRPHGISHRLLSKWEQAHAAIRHSETESLKSKNCMCLIGILSTSCNVWSNEPYEATRLTMYGNTNENGFAASTYEVANGGNQDRTMTDESMIISNTKKMNNTNGVETNGLETNGLEKNGVKPNVAQTNGAVQHTDHASLLGSILSLAHDAQAFAKSESANKAMRYEIRTAALALANSLEDPVEQAIRIVYETSPPTVALRIAFEGGFLRQLADGNVKTAAELSTDTGVDSVLIRLCLLRQRSQWFMLTGL